LESADYESAGAPPAANGRYAARSPQDAAAVPRAGLGRFWLVVAAWVVALLAVLPFDLQVTHWFRDVAPPDTYQRRALKLSVHLFHWRMYVALGCLLALHAKKRRLLIGYLAVLAMGFGCLYSLKYTIGRARPDDKVNGAECGAYYVQPFSGYDSFPSGHAVQAALLTALLSLYFPRLRWVLWPLAIAVCMSRLALDRHFPSDVLGGVGVSLLAVYLGVRWFGADSFPRLLPWRRQLTE
jgi:membrane-associated phospholipid phosphatase